MCASGKPSALPFCAEYFPPFLRVLLANVTLAPCADPAPTHACTPTCTMGRRRSVTDRGQCARAHPWVTNAGACARTCECHTHVLTDCCHTVRLLTVRHPLIVPSFPVSRLSATFMVHGPNGPQNASDEVPHVSWRGMQESLATPPIRSRNPQIQNSRNPEMGNPGIRKSGSQEIGKWEIQFQRFGDQWWGQPSPKAFIHPRWQLLIGSRYPPQSSHWQKL